MEKQDSEIGAPRVYRRSEHPVSRRNIDPDALKIISRLVYHGFKAFLVGGGVRDLLLDKRPKDFDIATDARPMKVKALFRNCRIIGRRFKLAHVYFAGGKIIEVSTFRDTQVAPELEESASRDALLITQDNIYGDERSDALRRDLTINALFYDLSTFSIVDYVGGMQDIKDRVVRVIGDPEIRFAEDPVRMMRVVRYAAKADFRIEKNCERAMLRNHELISKSSPVRVYEELKKDLCSGYCSKTIPMLAHYGLLEHLLPKLARHKSMASQDGPYARCLSLADRSMAAQGAGAAATPVLALLTLFSLEGEIKELTPQPHFRDEQEIYHFVVAAFGALPVPKKEREKIAGILGLWLRILTTPAHKIRPSQLARSEYLDDLLQLLEFLNPGGVHRDLIDFLGALQETRGPGSPKKQGGQHRDRRRGRQQRRPRHTMPGRMG
jgi:poly(A) polymerase